MTIKKAPARPGRLRPLFTGWVPVRDAAWRERAACAGWDTGVFYPAPDESALVAKGICRLCPVRLDCLAHAIQRRERFGVWGGLTEHERDLLRARLRWAAVAALPVRAAGDDDGPVAA